MKMEIAFPSKRRCLPITCHNIVLFHLLQHLPRVLAELCEEYRISLFDQTRDSGLILCHDCGEHPSFYCAFKLIGFKCQRYTSCSGRVHVLFGGTRKEDILFDLKRQKIPDHEAMLETVTLGRSAQDVLADMLREGAGIRHISDVMERTGPSIFDVMERTGPSKGSLEIAIVSKHFGPLRMTIVTELD